MLLFFRNLLAITALPFVVTVVVPLLLARRSDARLVFTGGPAHHAMQLAGLAALVTGLLLFISSLHRFIVDGRGTLAPWDPPRRLVVRGPYRYVRNPMIAGVAFVLFGEALILGSMLHLWWAVAFVVINAVYIPLVEEPPLAARFPAGYAEYRQHVPRLVPRSRPWKQPGGGVGDA